MITLSRFGIVVGRIPLEKRGQRVRYRVIIIIALSELEDINSSERSVLECNVRLPPPCHSVTEFAYLDQQDSSFIHHDLRDLDGLFCDDLPVGQSRPNLLLEYVLRVWNGILRRHNIPLVFLFVLLPVPLCDDGTSDDVRIEVPDPQLVVSRRVFPLVVSVNV